jgi:5-methylcytosine-specific restriction endonuclease McrA
VRTEFIKANPCPATGKSRGACPGWQVDHRIALVCGGPDTVENLQWLTVAEHREKTRAEVKLCRTNKHTR